MNKVKESNTLSVSIIRKLLRNSPKIEWNGEGETL